MRASTPSAMVLSATVCTDRKFSMDEWMVWSSTDKNSAFRMFSYVSLLSCPPSCSFLGMHSSYRKFGLTFASNITFCSGRYTHIPGGIQSDVGPKSWTYNRYKTSISTSPAVAGGTHTSQAGSSLLWAQIHLPVMNITPVLKTCCSLRYMHIVGRMQTNVGPKSCTCSITSCSLCYMHIPKLLAAIQLFTVLHQLQRSTSLNEIWYILNDRYLTFRCWMTHIWVAEWAL